MPLVTPTGAPMPRAMLGWDGTDFYVVRTNATGQLEIELVDAGALEGALQSVATDRLIVRGEDQLFSFHDVVQSAVSGAISGPGGYIESLGPVAGEVWVVTTVMARDDTTGVTAIRMSTWDAPTRWEFESLVRAFAIGERAIWGGHVYLRFGDTIRAYFTGGLAGDTCVIVLNGYIMTLEV